MLALVHDSIRRAIVSLSVSLSLSLSRLVINRKALVEACVFAYACLCLWLWLLVRVIEINWHGMKLLPQCAEGESVVTSIPLNNIEFKYLYIEIA